MDTAALTHLTINGKTYLDAKEIRANCKTYCKGIRSISQLILRKQYQDVVYGRVENGVVEITPTMSRQNGTAFINKDELAELFVVEENAPVIPEAPPILNDKDLFFFEDEDGRKYYVLMRGERTRGGLYFKLKDIEQLFQMKRLVDIIQKDDTVFSSGTHYQWFRVDNNVRELYFTYDGILRLIQKSYSFNCSYKEGFIYLIKLADNLYKYGKTWNLKRRVNTHKRIFARLGYSNISVVHTIKVDIDLLSKAESLVGKFLKERNLHSDIDHFNELCTLDATQYKELVAYYDQLESELLTEDKPLCATTREKFMQWFSGLEESGFVFAWGDTNQKIDYVASELKIDEEDLAKLVKDPDFITKQSVAHQDELEIMRARYERMIAEKELELTNKFAKKEIELARKIAEKSAELTAKQIEFANQLAGKDAQLTQMENMLSDKKDELIVAKKDAKLANKNVELIIAKNDIAIANKETELANKDTELAKKDTELIAAKKDVELAEMKIRILELQLQTSRGQN